MPEGRLRRRAQRSTAHPEDGIGKAKAGEIAQMLHMDMIAHRKKTADFNESWKRALCIASLGLAIVSILNTIEKAREGRPSWIQAGLTSTNAGLIALWVSGAEEQSKSRYLLVQGLSFALSLYQLLEWWKNPSGENEHADFPVSVILLVVACAIVTSMKSTLRTADSAFRASSALAEKVAAGRDQ